MAGAALGIGPERCWHVRPFAELRALERVSVLEASERTGGRTNERRHAIVLPEPSEGLDGLHTIRLRAKEVGR